MKLNKTELAVIARRMSNDVLRAKQAQQEADIKKMDEDNLPKAKELYDLLHSIPKKVKVHFKGSLKSYKSAFSLERIITDMRDKANSKYFNAGLFYEDILDDLIITQIECADVSILQKKVAKKYGI